MLLPPSEAEQRTGQVQVAQDTSDWAQSRGWMMTGQKGQTVQAFVANLGLREDGPLSTPELRLVVRRLDLEKAGSIWLLLPGEQRAEKGYLDADHPSILQFRFSRKADRGWLFVYQSAPEGVGFDDLGRYQLLHYDSSMKTMTVGGDFKPLTRPALNGLFLTLQKQMPEPGDAPPALAERLDNLRENYQKLPARSTVNYDSFIRQRLRYDPDKLPREGEYRRAHLSLRVWLDTLGNVTACTAGARPKGVDTALVSQARRIGMALPAFKPATLNRNPVPDDVILDIELAAPGRHRLTFDSTHVPRMYSSLPILQNRLKMDYGLRNERNFEMLLAALQDAGLGQLPETFFYDRMAIRLRPLTLQYGRSGYATVILPTSHSYLNIERGSTAYVPADASGFLLLTEERQAYTEYALIPFGPGQRTITPTNWSLLDDQSSAQIRETLLKAVK